MRWGGTGSGTGSGRCILDPSHHTLDWLVQGRPMLVENRVQLNQEPSPDLCIIGFQETCVISGNLAVDLKKTG